MPWEVDWSNRQNSGTHFIARNPESTHRKAREWHLVCAGYLRACGVNTPKFRADSWEVDWTQRDAKKVLARNPKSKMPSARTWHWVDQTTLIRGGVLWRNKSEHSGRYTDSRGYVNLSRRGMTKDDVDLAEQYGLFRGRRRTFVREHHLVACRKYRRPLNGLVVRHMNGIKSDNSPENIVIGTTQENTMDHNSARLAAMFWHSRCLELEAQLAAVKP